MVAVLEQGVKKGLGKGQGADIRAKVRRERGRELCAYFKNCVPGRGNRQCKGPEVAGAGLLCREYCELPEGDVPSSVVPTLPWSPKCREVWGLGQAWVIQGHLGRMMSRFLGWNRACGRADAEEGPAGGEELWKAEKGAEEQACL